MTGPTTTGPTFDLTGHVALVTGAGQGVGAGVATALGARGAAVAVNDLHAERAEATVAHLAAAGVTAMAAPFDVTDPDAVAAGVDAVRFRLGAVDVLVNNAGVPEGMGVAPFTDLPVEEWRHQLELNLLGSLQCIRAVLPGMVEQGWGRVVQISSAAGSVGLRIGVSAYGASKAGIEGAVRHLAVELGRTGVTVNAVALGLIANVEDPNITPLVRGLPIGRPGTPEDVGAAVAYVASPEASWLTGQTIHLDGGATIS